MNDSFNMLELAIALYDVLPLDSHLEQSANVVASLDFNTI